MRPECQSGLFCRDCRSRKRGKDVRHALSEVLDTAEVDYECPHGKPWGYVGGDAPETAKPTKTKPVRKHRKPVFVKSSETPDRAEACFECGWFDDVCRVKFPGGIGPTCWDKFLTNAASRCLAGKWESTLSKDRNGE